MINSYPITQNDLAYLCGCFYLETNALIKPEDSWHKSNFEKEKEEWFFNSNFYYKYFIDLFYPDSITKSQYRKCSHYIYPVNKELTHGTHHFIVKEINLYLLPFNFAIYTILIDQSGSNIHQNKNCLKCIRNNSSYSDKSISSEFLNVLNPIVKLYNSTRNNNSPQIQALKDYSRLTQNGDKFKIFHIVTLEQSSTASINNDLLFEIGTFDSINNYSSEYHDQILHNNKLSIFNNWTALALFDTFTILGDSNIQNDYLNDFKLHYFKYIYLNEFYVRNFMFHANARFRECNARISQIENEFKIFKRYFYFSKIAHNFILQELHDKIDSSLKIEHEFSQLQNYLQDERQRSEKINEKRFNTIINIITFTTLFSAIWDGTCLLEEVSGYQAKSIAIFLITIVTGIFVFFKLHLNSKK